MARLVEVGESRFGGKGLMSRRDFEAGDVVLVESPFLTVPTVEWEDLEAARSDSSASSTLIREAVARLDQTHTEAFWTFGAAPVYGETPTAQGIFWTNCIDVDPDKAGACMFLLTCRLNHNCKPNVRWTFDADKQHIYTRYTNFNV